MEDKIEQYLSYPLKDLYPQRDLPGDLFLFLNGHFVKLYHKDSQLTSEKYDLLLYKRIQFLFILKDDLDKYLSWSQSIENAQNNSILQNAPEEVKDMALKALAIKDEYLTFITKEVTSEDVQRMVEKTRSFLGQVKQKKLGERFFSQILLYGQGAADHSTNVANLSSYLAVNIGYNQQLLLETIYIGALLHDFGKTKINPQYLEDPNSDKAEIAMKKHPLLGKTALLLDSGFADEVLRIIAEHHERHDGKGYPKGLKGTRIYDLTKIVSIANTFDNFVRMENSGTVAERQKKALARIRSDNGHFFDPKILEKCVKALEFVF